MKEFANLLDRLAFESSRNAKITLIADYMRSTPDPDRGYALAVLTDSLVFRHAKAGLIRSLIQQKVDPVLFQLSYDYVGDLSETVALLWRDGEAHAAKSELTLTEAIEALSNAQKALLPGLVAGWLDSLPLNGRWALLKLVTGSLRVGVSSRLAKTAVAQIGDVAPDEIEKIWHGLSPPYINLFAWLEGKAEIPADTNPAPFRPPMLAHGLMEKDFDSLDPDDFLAEWKWDGIRVQAVAYTDEQGKRKSRLYSRTGEDLSSAFPDLHEALPFDGAIDGELLIFSNDKVQNFNILQQRLNRKAASTSLMSEHPAHIRVYDLLALGSEDLRDTPLVSRRARLEAVMAMHNSTRLSLSTLIQFQTWQDLREARANPAGAGAADDADAVEGCMIKRKDSPYLPGRPKGYWFKWKRDPYVVDAVMMYAQRGHGKRSSFYSDFTFGVWRDAPEGAELVPVGKAYFGFTDDELAELDRFVRRNTIDRHGPVRVVTATSETGLVLEVAFEGLNSSTRHKSGVAMRFPRISRIRWDKLPRDADTLSMLKAFLPQDKAQE